MIYDIAIVGGGIVGLATALALIETGVDSLIVLEAEDELAAHQSGHNSGVIHSGLYYKPGSMKAVLCSEGRERLYAFCAQHGIAHDRCGKLVVATQEKELPRLDALEEPGRANGLTLRRLAAHELQEYETQRCWTGRAVGNRNRNCRLRSSRTDLCAPGAGSRRRNPHRLDAQRLPPHARTDHFGIASG